MTSEKDELLEFNQYMKSDKMPYIIYADIASLIKQMDGCTNNPEKSSTKKLVSISLAGIQCQQLGLLIV